MSSRSHRSRFRERWAEFYAPYFPTARDARNFVAACRAQTPEAGAANEIMQHGRRLILLADDVARVRPGRDALPLLFMIICAEHASKRYHDSQKGQSAHHVRTFFGTFLSNEEKREMEGAFTTADGKPVDLAGAVNILYQVRCKVAHEGVYWGFAFKGGGRGGGKGPEVRAELSRRQLRDMVIRACIRAAMAKIDPSLVPVPLASISPPAESDRQQVDWREQRRLHAKYLRARFVPKCPGVEFSSRDWGVLLEKGCWMEALAAGKIAPLTPGQRDFVEVSRGRRQPASYYEELWDRYRSLASYYSIIARPDSWTVQDEDDWRDDDDEHDLLAAELDSDAEAWAQSDEDGWYYSDDSGEEDFGWDEEDSDWDDDEDEEEIGWDDDDDY
jgi:uncharacterized protein YifE (UPF0438 family)